MSDNERMWETVLRNSKVPKRKTLDQPKPSGKRERKPRRRPEARKCGHGIKLWDCKPCVAQYHRDRHKIVSGHVPA